MDGDFTAAAPNQRWAGDTTEFAIGEHAKLYLEVILDLYSRFVVGWAVSAVNDRRLTLKALEMAIGVAVPNRVCCTIRIGAALTPVTTIRRS